MSMALPKPVVLLLLSTVVFVAKAADENPAPTEADIAERMGGREVMQIVREATRIEGVRVDRVERPPDKEGRVYFDVVPRGKLFEFEAKKVERTRKLLGDHTQYNMSSKYCGFSPGVRLVFHHRTLGDLEMNICLHCSELEVSRQNKEPRRISFDPGEAKVRELMVDLFPDNKDIRELIAEDEADRKKAEAEEARWLAATPKSLLPFRNREGVLRLSVDLTGHRAALRKEFPEATLRILALLTWFGSGKGPWYWGYGADEEDAGDLLMDFSTAELLTAIESATLTENQIEGAARLFCGRKFGEERGADRAALPAALKRRLLKQALKSSEEQNREGARKALSGP